MKPRFGEQLILLGDQAGAAHYVPLCRDNARLLALRLTKGAVLSHKLAFRDGWALIKVRAGRSRIVIYAESPQVQYEFFTSEGILGNLLASPPYDDESIYGTFVCGRGSWHQFGRNGAPKSQALVELCGTCETPPEASWPVFACHDITGEVEMRTHYAWQNQRAWEYVWWPNNEGGQFVTSAAGAVPCYNSIGRYGRMNVGNGVNNKDYYEDIGWDLRPSLYDYQGTDALAHGAPNLIAPNWWRRACVKTVNGQQFFVMNDAAGNFHFWKAADYGGTLVPAAHVKSVAPAYPSWVDGGIALWNYNKDASKAVCVPYQQYDPPLTADSETVYKDCWTGFYRVRPGDPGVDSVCDCFEDSPGLLEVAISITEVDDDFFPSVTVTRQERFVDTGHYTISADYAFDDARLPYPEDTLVVLEYDLYIQGGTYFVNGGSHWPDDFAGRLRGAFVINAWVNGAWQFVRRIATTLDTLWERTGATGGYYAKPGGGTFFAYPDYFGVFDITEFGYAASIASLNLRALTWYQTRQRYAAGLGMGPNDWWYLQSEVWAYGELAEQVNPFAQAGEPNWSTVGYTRVDSDKRELWSIAFRSALPHYPAGQISVHPKGHWAVSSAQYPVGDPDAWMVDVVNVRRNGKDVRYRHQDLYNAAFNDTRDLAYYVQLGADEPAGQDAPLGMFATFGIWRDK